MKLTIKPGKIKGGLSEKKKRMDVDPKQLSMGIEVEMEHTDDKEVAKEIALDHLAEDKNYYTKLKKMEAEKSMDKNEITNEKIQKSLDYLYKESFELFKMGRKIKDGSVRQINDLVFEKSGVNWNLVGTALVKASEIAEAPTTIRIFDNKGDTWQRFTIIINNRVYTAGRGILKTVSDMQHGNAVYPNEGLDYQGNLVNITPEGLLVYSRENHLFPIGNELTEVPYGIALAINELVMKSMVDKEEELEKGKKFPDGTVREWKGKKFRKQGGKWVKVSDKKSEGGSKLKESKGKYTSVLQSKAQANKWIGILKQDDSQESKDAAKFLESGWERVAARPETAEKLFNKVKSVAEKHGIKFSKSFDEDIEEFEKAIRVFNNEDTILFLNKGKGLPPGTIRDWKGKKYQKQSNGKWKRYTEIKSGSGLKDFTVVDNNNSSRSVKIKAKDKNDAMDRGASELKTTNIRVYEKNEKDSSKRSDVRDNPKKDSVSKALNELGIDEEYHIAVKDILDKEGLGVDDVELISEDSSTGIVVGFENMEFAICTDEQADELATQRLKDIIDDIGVSAFNKDFVMSHIDKDKLSRDLVEGEMDVVWDDPDMYLSEDPEGEDGDWTDEQREKAQEIMKERIEDDPLDYVMNMFGEGKEADNFLSQYIDEEALIEDAIQYDGRGHTISGYDGFEHEVSKKGENSIFYYRVN